MTDTSDPIYCFNDAECVYKGRCYNETLGVCEFEWLKAIFKAGAPQPSAPTQRTPTPFRRAKPDVEPKKSDSTPYSAITKESKSVKVEGKIESIVEREVNKKDGTTQKILKVFLSNGREKLTITFWNPDEVPDIQEGMDVEISGLMGNSPYKGDAQASGGKFTKITVK
jgi:hypothetical protein